MAWRAHGYAAAVVLLMAAAQKEDATCQGGAAQAASLLQRDFQRDGKSILAAEQTPPVCTGTTAQDRCWYLSAMGESCDGTCARNGRNFWYMVADTERPLTPALVGHEPTVKQQPWAALECYVPSDDRYHTANANSAKHVDGTIGAWSHADCKLACPCSMAGAAVNPVQPAVNPVQPTSTVLCGWKQPPACASEFVWKGEPYSGCAPADGEHERPWCLHGSGYTTSIVWSFCADNCSSDSPSGLHSWGEAAVKDGCEWSLAPSCVKEYDYEGAHYVGCTNTDHETPWCSNADPYRGSWNHCISSCAGNVRADEIEELCSWQSKQECAKSFQYKGIEYRGCTTEDNPTPWCSLNSVHQGDWTPCTRVCSRASQTLSPTLSPA